MSDTMTLPYGLHEAVPTGAKAAWGARFIISMSGHVDLPPDRQGFMGDQADRETLNEAMNAACGLQDLMRSIKDAIKDGRIMLTVANRVTLFSDETITVVADSKASSGYLYVAAFRTAKPEEWVDFDVQMTVIVNIPISAKNSEFSKADARVHAIDAVVGAIESYTAGDAEVSEITAVET